MRKSFFILTVLSLALVACEREYNNHENLAPEVVTVHARMVDAMMEVPTSRTVIMDEAARSVGWTPRDEMSLFYGTGTSGGNKFTSTNTENKSVADFEGTIGVVTAGADFPIDKTYFWGLYPYDPEASCDGTSIVTTLSPNQTAVAGSFETGRVISIARSQNLGLSFYNVCSGLRVKVVKEGVVRMTMKSLDGSPLAGKARIAMNDSGIPYVQEVLEGSDEIVLSAPAGKYLEPGENYYFMFFPHDFNTSFFTITFETMTESATYERKRAFKFNRSDINEFSVPIDQSLTYSAKDGNIPIEDPAFKTWLTSNGFDTDADGEISYAEAENVEQIWIGASEEFNIQSLQGIEYMPNLTHLFCAGGWYDYVMDDLPEHSYISQERIQSGAGGGPTGTLKKVDVSYNHKLVLLNLAHCEGLGETIGEIDLSNNPELEDLCISFNGLRFPEISHLTKLKYFESRGNKGQVPDFSQFTNLDYLEITCPADDNDFDVDITNSPNIESLKVEWTRGTITGIAQKTQLKQLEIDNSWEIGPIASENAQMLREVVPTLTNLERLRCNNCDLGSLDVSALTNLQYLELRSNNLTELSVGANTELTQLVFANNSIQSIDLSGLSKLEILSADQNPLAELDLSHNPELLDIDCSGTNMTSLDLSANTKLQAVLCRWNQLTSIDLSHNPELTCIDFRWNNITTMDVSNNTKLSLATKDGDRTGLFCVQNEDENGIDKLQTLYIAEGQVIPFVTVDRSARRISPTTNIQVAPGDGGIDNYGGSTQDP